MNKYRFEYLLTLALQTCRDCKIQAVFCEKEPGGCRAPYPHCDMDSCSSQILTADRGGPGTVLVLESHKHIPQVQKDGAEAEHEKNSYTLGKLVGRSNGQGEGWRKSGSIWRKTVLPMDPVLLLV